VTPMYSAVSYEGVPCCSVCWQVMTAARRKKDLGSYVWLTILLACGIKMQVTFRCRSVLHIGCDAYCCQCEISMAFALTPDWRYVPHLVTASRSGLCGVAGVPRLGRSDMHACCLQTCVSAFSSGTASFLMVFMKSSLLERRQTQGLHAELVRVCSSSCGKCPC
jgi:hypothetical protein